MLSTSWANNHHGVTTFVVNEMVSNATNSIPQKQSMTFP